MKTTPVTGSTSRLFSLASGLLLLLGAACTELPAPAPSPVPPASNTPQGIVNFAAVVARVEPVAEQVCRQRAKPGTNCNFLIYVDNDPKKPPNAFQTRDKAGRPQIGMTIALIKMMRNNDELAFVLGHEASHHVLGHIDQTVEQAVAGAIVGGILATISGGDQAAVEVAQRTGATLGARRYSKNFELEADSLGTVIAFRSGFDPLRGAEFFTRLPDPGNAFLGSHPPNSARIATVRKTAASLQ